MLWVWVNDYRLQVVEDGAAYQDAAGKSRKQTKRQSGQKTSLKQGASMGS